MWCKHTGISDHSLIYGIKKINIRHKDNNIIEIRNMKKFNEQQFLQDLGTQTWEHIYFFADILTLCGIFGNNFSYKS